MLPVRLSRFAKRGAAFAVLTAVGCDRSGDPLAPWPVEFQVRVADKPAAGATVVLHKVGGDPKAAGTKPMGRVDDAGTVRISTFARDDGAPAGEYAVTVTWHEKAVSTAEQIETLGRDRFGGKYSKPDAPKAPKLTVRAEPNKLPPLQL
jgi:hypothetical protein